MAERMPPVPGVRDLASLLYFIDVWDDAQKSKWLADARKVAKENREAARLLGSTAKIEADMDAADRARATAEDVLENARAQAESIVEDAQEDLARREMAIKDDAARLKADRDAFAETVSEKTSELADKENALTVREDAIVEREANVGERETEVEAYDARVRKREAAARKAKAEAEEIKRKARELTGG